ncbi:MAG: hypothetical protein OEV85_11640 [Candidatus Thorarchaeota archaeon]|nr:hypothetical protein [Candidatus Thorarchaeota archaeon]
MKQLKDALEYESEIGWTNIIHLTPDSQGVNVKFRIFKRGATRQVTSKSSGRKHKIATFEIADSTARINLVLWNDDIDLLDNDDDFYLLNGYVTLHDECMSLSKGRNGAIRKSSTSIGPMNDNIDMSRPFIWKPRRRTSRSITSRTLNGSSGREARRYTSRKSF